MLQPWLGYAVRDAYCYLCFRSINLLTWTQRHLNLHSHTFVSATSSALGAQRTLAFQSNSLAIARALLNSWRRDDWLRRGRRCSLTHLSYPTQRLHAAVRLFFITTEWINTLARSSSFLLQLSTKNPPNTPKPPKPTRRTTPAHPKIPNPRRRVPRAVVPRTSTSATFRLPTQSKKRKKRARRTRMGMSRCVWMRVMRRRVRVRG